MAVIEAQEDHEAHKAAVAAQQKYLTDILDDGKHNVDLGVYRPEIEKVKAD